MRQRIAHWMRHLARKQHALLSAWADAIAPDAITQALGPAVGNVIPADLQALLDARRAQMLDAEDAQRGGEWPRHGVVTAFTRAKGRR